MYWNRTAAGDVREEMPLSSISRGAGAPAATAESANPGTSTQITSTCCTPPPSYHNINLPLGHPSTLTNERGAPPSYEEAIDPNGMSSPEIACIRMPARPNTSVFLYRFQHHRRPTTPCSVV